MHGRINYEARKAPAIEKSDRKIAVFEKSTSNKMSNKMRNIKDSGRDSLRVGLWVFTCEPSPFLIILLSAAVVFFRLGRRPWTAIQKREELSQDPAGCAKIRSALGNEHRENEPPTCEEDVPEQALDRQDGPVPPLRLHLGGTMPPLRKWVPRPPSRS